MTTTDLDRFLDKIAIGDGCWEWQAYKNRGGYGSFRYAGQLRPAYRFAYELMVGPIPAGYHVDHLCRNPRCVRFDHLEAVTPSENSRRRAGWAAQKLFCPNGHQYTPTNTGKDKGYAYCRECKRASCRAYYERRKALIATTGSRYVPVKDGSVCHRGHEMSEANVYVRPNGKRQCRECTRISKRGCRP